MSVVDIIVIVVLAIFAIIGFVKGFLNTLLSLFGNLASLAIAIVIVEPCTKFLNNIFGIVNWLGGLIVNGLTSAGILPISMEGASWTGQQVVDHLNGQGGLIEKLVTLFIDKEALYYSGETAIEGATELTSFLSDKMGNFAAMIFTVIIMFILIRVGILILSKIFDAITKKRALSGLDRLLGATIGLLKGGVIVFAVLSVMYALAPIIPIINDWISTAPFTQWIYGYVSELINWAIKSIDFTAFIN